VWLKAVVAALALANAAAARAEGPGPHEPPLTEERLQSFAALSLKCVGQEYSNKPNLTLDSAADLKSNRDLHPIFFGCFDWHSAVHGHWALVRILKLSKDEALRKRIWEALDRDFTPEKVATELRYFTEGSAAERFERPYGYGWLLRLALELRTLEHPRAAEWAKTLEPLEKRIRELYLKTFDRFDFPVRVGLHENFAFAMAHAYDYAKGRGDSELLSAIRKRALSYYGKDERCPIAYEPSGEDFLSPCLAEAEVMARVLEPAAFGRWLNGFLDARALARFLQPVSPRADALKDPRTVHLVGLNFQKAWALHRVANALPARDPLRTKLMAAADAHRAKSTELMFLSDYGGTHWLASFALYDWSGVGLE
jgi:hypothetical protein